LIPGVEVYTVTFLPVSLDAKAANSLARFRDRPTLSATSSRVRGGVLTATVIYFKASSAEVYHGSSGSGREASITHSFRFGVCVWRIDTPTDSPAHRQIRTHHSIFIGFLMCLGAFFRSGCSLSVSRLLPYVSSWACSSENPSSPLVVFRIVFNKSGKPGKYGNMAKPAVL
jgi:hypothetical protein